VEAIDWYALFVKTGDEDNVKDRIKYRNKDKFDIVVPKRILREKKQGIWLNKIRIIFPGYVLVKGHVSIEDYYEFKDIPGIISFIRSGDKLLKIKKDEVFILSKLIHNGETIGFSKAFIENERVKIIEGPLKEMEGYIISINKRKKRAKIKISFMDEERTVELGINFLNLVDV